MSSRDAAKVVNAWEASSQYWDKHQGAIEKIFAPLTRALVEVAAIQPGQSVLDIGGGSGEPSLTLSRITGASGAVTYTDPAPGMLKTASDEAARRGLSNIAFHQCPAEELPFADNSFDAVVGRLSAMFFTDAHLALKQILRVTKSGGRVTLLVWSSPAANPFFSVINQVLNHFVPAEPVDEDAPAAFRFAQPGKLAGLLRDAGATEVTENMLESRIEHAIGVDQFWKMRTEMSDGFRTKLAQLPPEKLDEVKAVATVELTDYFKDGTMNFPSEALIVSGRKP